MIRSFTLVFTLLIGTQATAFCGFYVAQDDGELYNEAAKVVFVRDGNRSRITMASDYTGPTSEFAMIVPTPTVLEEKHIRTVDPAAVTHLENYTAPRLVEYFDRDPCEPEILFSPPVAIAEAESSTPTPRRGPAALGVKVEAEYSVGEYDIVILSARQSDGLITYLRQEDYKIPDGAENTLADYIAMDMKFFVARVNLERHAQGQSQDLKPLQISFRSENFMLPLQLGKINSAGTQDLLIYMLTRSDQGRVEAANYDNARIPSDVSVPTFVEGMFGQFYRDMFAKNAAPNTVMTEYAWDMGWCDPCAADPLNLFELRDLGAVWVKSAKENPSEDVFVTRLHIQYDRDEFPNDLQFRITGDSNNFQGRYIMNQPFEGEITCEAGQDYVTQKRDQIRADALALRDLTNWRQSDIDRLITQSVPARFR